MSNTLAASEIEQSLGISPLTVRKRSGKEASFDPERIRVAIEKAFRADQRIDESAALEQPMLEAVKDITTEVVTSLEDAVTEEGILDIEKVQDAVENQLMKKGHFSVARRYILYREERRKSRILRGEGGAEQQLMIKSIDGREVPLDIKALTDEIHEACEVSESTDPEPILDEVKRSIYSNISEEELGRAKLLASRTLIEKEPEYAKVTAKLLLNIVYREVFGETPAAAERRAAYKEHFRPFLELGIRAERLDPKLLEYDLEAIADAIVPERDDDFRYMGLQTIYDRYLLHVEDRRIETPQYFWMRVSMGLALLEGEQKTARAIEFYNMLSTFRFVSSTPTLFNAGTLHPQLSSCYLSTTDDSLDHIFKVVSDNAKLSKWAGGLGNDWTNVRATGARIKGTNGESQGVMPFLKVVNDTAVAVNQGGKRKGAVCAYLENWHLETEEFQELRKNTGDERRRTHDMNTANWIPDLFMKRVLADGTWTLFSPDEVPDLHDLYGQEFESRYLQYEKKAREGEIKKFKSIPANQLWRKMLSMLFETGHPWITFKDPSNIRSPQDHVGVVHSSNLCTEILLNTSKEETAVCNLGSVNLVQHFTDGKLDEVKLRETIRTAVRMLDNVIDINFYPTQEAKNSNSKHRPVGLGLMGFQDALHILGHGYASDEAVEFADYSMEVISHAAILASSELAGEKGTYETYKGSKWDRGMLPMDTLEMLQIERGGYLEVDTGSRMDWEEVRKSVKENGMRNSNVMAIAPTATIANIAGVSQSIEPTFRHLYVKSNLSGEFTVVNEHLVKDLKELNLWDEEMIEDLKYFDGVLTEIERIPDHIKEIYKTAIDIEPQWLIECGSRRQKWIDMGQSLNLYINQPSGKLLNDMYVMAWKKGLKTTYYLRSLAATQVEKSTLDVNKRGIQPRWMKSKSASSDIKIDRQQEPVKMCSLDDPDCEACQ